MGKGGVRAPPAKIAPPLHPSPPLPAALLTGEEVCAEQEQERLLTREESHWGAPPTPSHASRPASTQQVPERRRGSPRPPLAAIPGHPPRLPDRPTDRPAAELRFRARPLALPKPLAREGGGARPAGTSSSSEGRAGGGGGGFFGGAAQSCGGFFCGFSLARPPAGVSEVRPGEAKSRAGAAGQERNKGRRGAGGWGVLAEHLAWRDRPSAGRGW